MFINYIYPELGSNKSIKLAGQISLEVSVQVGVLRLSFDWHLTLKILKWHQIWVWKENGTTTREIITKNAHFLKICGAYLQYSFQPKCYSSHSIYYNEFNTIILILTLISSYILTIILIYNPNPPPPPHWHWKVVRGCTALKTQINLPLPIPHFKHNCQYPSHFWINLYSLP